MNIKAYDELYLTDAINCLSTAFDYAINICGLNPNEFMELFLKSSVSKHFEKGNPLYVAGKSGIELVYCVIDELKYPIELPDYIGCLSKSKEYWAGWALAQYQWHTAKSFKKIFERVKLSEIIQMYTVYHEMDVFHFITDLDYIYYKKEKPSNLSVVRKLRNLSQIQLSELSGVSLRSIQLYEQKVNDIDKAQAHTVYKLAYVLNCEIEDILENPELLKN